MTDKPHSTRNPRARVLQWTFLILLSVVSVFTGVTDITPGGLLDIETAQMKVLLISRLPRLLSIIITGGSLSVAGLIMQSIMQNRFVSPTTAGTMEWCRLGVMLAILAFSDLPPLLRVASAFVISLAGTMLFVLLIDKIKTRSVILVPLAGMMLGSVVNAVTVFFAYSNDIMQNMTTWLQGNFALIIKGNYELLYVGVPLMILGYLYADRFTIAGMGKDMATGLGLNHAATMRVGLVLIALISSVTIVSVGNIPFLGLVVPNLIRLYRGDSLKNTLFETAWLGAILVLFCDITGRTLIYPYEIPIGIIFSVMGGGMFLTLLLRRKSHAA